MAALLYSTPWGSHPVGAKLASVVPEPPAGKVPKGIPASGFCALVCIYLCECGHPCPLVCISPCLLHPWFQCALWVWSVHISRLSAEQNGIRNGDNIQNFGLSCTYCQKVTKYLNSNGRPQTLLIKHRVRLDLLDVSTDSLTCKQAGGTPLVHRFSVAGDLE